MSCHDLLSPDPPLHHVPCSPKVGCIAASWGGKGALEVGTSKSIAPLFITEVTLDQILGKWYHFIKPIQCIKNLLTAKQLLNVLFYCYYLPY